MELESIETGVLAASRSVLLRCVDGVVYMQRISNEASTSPSLSSLARQQFTIHLVQRKTNHCQNRNIGFSKKKEQKHWKSLERENTDCGGRPAQRPALLLWVTQRPGPPAENQKTSNLEVVCYLAQLPSGLLGLFRCGFCVKQTTHRLSSSANVRLQRLKLWIHSIPLLGAKEGATHFFKGHSFRTITIFQSRRNATTIRHYNL